MFHMNELQSAGIISIDTKTISGEIAEIGSACNIEMLQGVYVNVC